MSTLAREVKDGSDECGFGCERAGTVLFDEGSIVIMVGACAMPWSCVFGCEKRGPEWVRNSLRRCDEGPAAVRGPPKP